MTTINNTFKSKVMKAAWSSIRKGFASNLSQALASAWKWAKKTLVEKVIVFQGCLERTTDKAQLWSVCVGMRHEEKWIPKSAILKITEHVGSYNMVTLASWFKF